jgi:hypothetical protein
MRLILTAAEALHKGIWAELCEVKGINEYAISEGLMDADDEIDLSEDELRTLDRLMRRHRRYVILLSTPSLVVGYTTFDQNGGS